MFSEFLDKIFGNKSQQAKRVTTSISNVNLKFMGAAHALEGMETDSIVFEYKVPFQNRIGEQIPDHLKGPQITINSISVSEPFELVSVEPILPAKVPYKAKADFTLWIKAPNVLYKGPLSISMSSDPSESIAVDVKGISLEYKDKQVELEHSAIASSMQKSQIFKKDIQLYKIAGLNDHITSISVEAPFELVDTNPKLPIIADKKDSYVVSLYIKAPQSSYAGGLKIKLS